MRGFRFLSEDEFKNSRLFKYCPKNAKVTDFAILTGASLFDEDKRIGYWWLRDIVDINNIKEALYVGGTGDVGNFRYSFSRIGARPVVDYSVISSHSIMLEELDFGLFEVECGEYPKRVVDDDLSDILEYSRSLGNLKRCNNCFTIIDHKSHMHNLKPVKSDVYEYRGKKYIRMMRQGDRADVLSNGKRAIGRKPFWLTVEPIVWIVDEKNNIAMTRDIVFGGVHFDVGKKNGNYSFFVNRSDDAHYAEDFENTFIKRYMDSYFANEILPKGALNINSGLAEEFEEEERKRLKSYNPYEFDLGGVSEEDIIKGAIESDISVFLHGKSGDGKSDRVKTLDPDCEIIYMRNATPESLNGKSVYNASTGEMIDVPPTWYKKVLEKCSNEPNKIHIVFFDELTNALPSMQGMAFNIILDKEINGKWKLPKNARIVAAGNDLDDSLAANKMAEPLFSRFAHVYIRTEVDDWVKWAMDEDDSQRLDYVESKEEGIHPAIISYIEYWNNKGYNVLREPYNGEEPNADPRKWEMASKVLYKTNKPQMLRALLGKRATNEFIIYVSYKRETINYNDSYFSYKDKQEDVKTVKRLSL